MPEINMETIQAELKKASDPIKELLDKQDIEIKQYGETSKQLRDDLNAAEKKYSDLEKQLKEKTDELHAKLDRPDYSGKSGERKATAGQRFIMSQEYKDARARGLKSTDTVMLGDLFESKTISNATVPDSSDGAPVWPEQVSELFFDPGQREITIRDIMNTVPTNSDSIEFFRETDAFEDGDAAAQDGQTNTKEQLEINFSKLDAPVQTIAAWVPAGRQVLDDAPALQSHIDSRLRHKVLKQMEDDVLFGDGQSGALLGIHNTDGVQTTGAPDSTDESGVLTHIRKSFARVRVNEYMATAIILHPNDWAELETAIGTDGHYIWTTVPNGGEPRLWRVPVVETTAMQEGRFLTGAFGIGAQLWDRQQASVRVSEHHSDYFVRNAVAILAELRVALTVYRPKAFIKGTLNTEIAT